MKQPKYEYHYKKHGLKHVAGFIPMELYQKLKQLAKDEDRSLTKYVTRLLEHHVDRMWAQRTEETNTPRQHFKKD